MASISQLATVGIEDVDVETPLSINLLPNHHIPAQWRYFPVTSIICKHNEHASRSTL